MNCIEATAGVAGHLEDFKNFATDFSLLLASDGRKEQVGRAEEMAQRFGQLAVINCSYFEGEDEILGYHERLGHVLQVPAFLGVKSR